MLFNTLRTGLIAALLFAVQLGGAPGLPGVAHAARNSGIGIISELILERVLVTREGEQLARALMGNVGTAPATTREVLNVLLHPENRAFAESLNSRFTEIDRELAALRARRAGDSLSAGELLRLENELIANEARRLLALRRADAGTVVFVDNSSYRVKTAYASMKADFLLGGTATGPGSGVTGSILAPPPPGYSPDAFEQFLRWEESASLRYFRETELFVGMDVAAVDAAGVKIEAASDLPPALKRYFVRDGKVFWPRHPYNTDLSVPFSRAGAVEVWPSRFTASRSMVIWDRSSGVAFSLKAPTNYPHRTELQPGKANLKDDVAAAIQRSEYIAKMDRLLGPDKEVKILKEIFTASERTSGNGYVVRELGPIQDGFYYLPALSIPYAGEGIARLNGQTLERFWGEAYARLLGKAKARLLLRYGLQMETPNSQNMLIQLDRNMRPTGKIVFRDVSDSLTVKPVIEAIGQDGLLVKDAAIGYEPMSNLNTMTDNSFWRLDEDPIFGIPRRTLSGWMKLHDEAYVHEILRTLGVDPSSAVGSGIRSIQDVERYLFSEEGTRALRQYHGNLKRAAERGATARLVAA